MSVKVLAGSQKITEKQNDAIFGTAHDVKITKAILLKDDSANIADYVGGGTECDLTLLRLDNGNIGINIQKSLENRLEYNRIYFMNTANEELVCLRVELKNESEINIDVEIQIGQGNSVSIIAT